MLLLFSGKGRISTHATAHQVQGVVYILEGGFFRLAVERRQRCDDAEILGTNVSVVSRLTTGIE
jgi:hypothetical protein